MIKKIVIVLCIIVGVLICAMIGVKNWFTAQTRVMHLCEPAFVSDSLIVLKGKISNMFLVRKNNTMVAFDAADDAALVRKECQALQIDPSMVKAVFFTHSDGDHVNGLPAFSAAKAYLCKDEEALLKESKYRHFLGLPHKNSIPGGTYALVSDGDSVSVDGIVVHAVATPGHTRGSMCYRVGGALFTGDLLMLVNGKVEPMIKIFTENMSIDSQSIRNVARMNNVTSIYTAHSGYTTDLQAAFAAWK